MTLREIYPIAERIKRELDPFCDRLEIAGSIRRARDWCNDIDLVCLPKIGKMAAIHERMTLRSAVVSDGPQILIVRLKTGLQVDLYWTHHSDRDLLTAFPSNFGSVYLCRTGSKEHNIRICQKAQEFGLHWNPVVGLCDATGKVIASETEEDIFKALGMEFIPPAFREIA